MKFTRSIVPAILFASLATTAARAQTVPTPTPAPTEAEQEAALAARAELETKATALLSEAAAEADSLRLAENRARLQAVAAAALWPRDQEGAREIFQSALAAVSSVAATLTPEEPRYEQHYHRIQNLRREIAFAVAQREPKLALDFVRGTRLPPLPRAGDSNAHQPDHELAIEMQLVELLAARDPREAVRLAEESLSRGVSGHLPSLIERVRQSDAQAASKLAADTLRKLRSTNFSTNNEAASVASYLLQATRPPASPGPNGVATQAGPNVAVLPAGGDARALTLDEAARRDLLALVVNAALAGGAEPRTRGRGRDGGQLLSAVRAVMPEVERLMPAQAQALRRRMGESEGGPAQPPQRARWQEFEQLMQTGTTDAILQAAQRAPNEMRWQLYRRAATKAIEEGSPERARQIVNDSVTEPRMREQLLREIDQQLFWRAAGQGDSAQALALLGRVKSPEERTSMTMALAQMAAAAGNRELAERLLEEVLGQAAGRAKNMQQFSAQLQVGHAYALFAPERGLQIAESCIEHLNELMGAAMQVDGFGQEAFEQGELKLEGSVWSSMVQQTAELLANLAPKDFDRAREVAGRFQRAEARAHALLAVARGVLGGDHHTSGRRRGRTRPSVIRGRD